MDLYVAYWALVGERITLTYQAKEIIYETLRRTGVEIPFPQRDVHIKQ